LSDLTAGQIDELLGALRDAVAGDAGPDNAATTADIVAHLVKTTGRAEQYVVRLVRAAVAKLQADGRLERVEIRRISPVDGRNCKLKAYRLVA
jgi:hypothetical protein